MAKPITVELVHFRDPDSSCDLHVFVNGAEITEITEVNIDAGAGYGREDWDEHRRYSLENLTPGARELAQVLFAVADESPYIDEGES